MGGGTRSDLAASESTDSTVVPIEIVDELVAAPRRPPPTPTRPPPVPPRARTSTRSMPPLAAETRRRPVLPRPEARQPQSPTVIDRAREVALEASPKTRADQMARELERAALADPAAAARLGYELGELHERRLGDEERALRAYRRAFELDPALRANAWALRRVLYHRARWPELAKVIDAELGHAAGEHERAELLFERAIVSGHQGDADEQDASALGAALELAPLHQGALLELERVAARSGDVTSLLDLWDKLARATRQPERQIMYRLAIARDAAAIDAPRARAALEAATAVLEGSARSSRWRIAEQVARERLRFADAYGTPAEIAAALDALVQVPIISASPAAGEHPSRAAARRTELAALRRRQARLARPEAPQAAWEHLLRARAMAPDDAVVAAELIELASELERGDELGELVASWQEIEDEIGRANLLSWWCAEAHLPGRRGRLRALLASVQTAAPGFVLLTSAAECDALADPSRVRAQLDLANTYQAAARAAMRGTWLGPWSPPRPDAAASAALYVQAAHLLACYVATPAALDQARDALGRALAAVPGNAAAIESLVELDDRTGRGAEAVARLRELAAAARGDRAILQRATRVAYAHGLAEPVVELQRELVARAPEDHAASWRLEATLAQLGRDTDRAELLARLAGADPDPARRRTAQLAAARLREAAGALAPATELYRELIASWPDDSLPRDALIDLLRAQERWAELVAERRAEAAAAGDDGLARRAWREAAWVLEIELDDRAGAAEVYQAWLARLPADRTALEGLARCRAGLGDAAGEAEARAQIADLDGTAEARWLHARSLERAGRLEQAAEQYRGLVAADGAPVAATASALALGDLAARAGDLDMYIEASDALARRSTDPGLGAALFEDCGWMCAVAVEDIERSAESFAAALELQPNRPGALLGAALVAACRSDPMALAGAYVQLAATMKVPDAAAALWLRAAATAAADGEPELAAERIEAARVAAPDSVDALVVAADVSPVQPPDTADPFAAADRLLARAELLEKRAALADDPALRAGWELDRAEALELAGQPREASEALVAVLAQRPDDWRALWALRRIAQHARKEVTHAEASYALARLARDRELRLRMLRDAAEVYDRASPARQPDFALAAYRRILEIDPGAPELERVVAILRERADARGLIAALTARIGHLEPTPDGDPAVAALLIERASLLRAAGHQAAAVADLDAVLVHAHDHVEALRLRAELAVDANDLPRAIALWWRYLAVETAEPRRAEIEALLAQALDRTGSRTPTPQPRSEDSTTGVRLVDERADMWDPETTSTDASPPTRPAHADPFGSTTLVADLRELQEEERLAARAVAPHGDVIVPGPGEVTVNSAIAAAVGASVGGDTALPGGRKLRPPALDLAALFPIAPDTTRPAELEPVLDLGALQWTEQDELSPDDSAVVMLSLDQLQPASSGLAFRDLLEQCERELAVAGEGAGAVGLRLEAGRLAEVLGELERARTHYEAALLADPRAGAAVRGLRRIARAGGDFGEVARLVGAELAIAGPRERAPLRRYRLDLLMAVGEQDLARVAAGELLDASPLELPALLAQLELAFLDARADEFGVALEQLASAVTDPELRGAARAARAILAVRVGEPATAVQWFAAAAEADPGSLATRLDAIRHAAPPGTARTALLELALEIEAGDPTTAAAIAVRLPEWAAGDQAGDADRLASAIQLAAGAAPRDPLVARLAAESSLGTSERSVSSHAFARWARCSTAPAERAYAAARAAELEPGRLARLWGQVLELDPGDDHAAAQLRASQLAAGQARAAIDLDLQLARDTGRDRPRLRAAAALVEQGEVDEAIAVLAEGRARKPGSHVLGGALATAYARAGRWAERATLLGELAGDPGPFARDVARLHAALAAEQHARLVAKAGSAPRAELERTVIAALEAWDLVLQDDPQAEIAHAAAIHLAGHLDEHALLMDVLARAQAAEREPWAASSLALRRARLTARSDPRFAFEIARDAAPGLDDPRRTLEVMLAAASCRELGEVATALEQRAAQLDAVRTSTEPSIEVAVLRLRAALLALEVDDAARAVALLSQAAPVLPGVADDVLEVAYVRAGLEPPPRPAGTRADTFARVLRDADVAAELGDHAAAIELYERALDLRPGHPFAWAPLVRIGMAQREAAPLAAFALEQIRSAEAIGDPIAKSEAYELLARVEALRGDAASALMALETASRADPGRLDLMHRLERELAGRGHHGDLLHLRERQIRLAQRALAEAGTTSSPEHAQDLAALILDAATLAVRDKRSDARLADLYRAALAADPKHRLALFHLEAIVRRAGASDRLAALEEQIASCLDDPHAKASFLTRAGETLAALGRGAEAVQRFGRAIDVLDGHAPALEAWQQTALEHELWLELAEVAMRRARLAVEPKATAAHLHFAGVALMDHAHASDLAIATLRRVLDAEPAHLDAFLRLRLLLERAGKPDELAALLRARLDLEHEAGEQLELHFALAGLGRAAGNRELALQHYRAMLGIDPGDGRALAAMADLTGEGGRRPTS